MYPFKTVSRELRDRKLNNQPGSSCLWGLILAYPVHIGYVTDLFPKHNDLNLLDPPHGLLFHVNVIGMR